MKFNVLYKNLVLEQDAPPINDVAPMPQPAAPEATVATNKTPQPENFNDVAPSNTAASLNAVQQLIQRLLDLSEEINGIKSGTSIQQRIYDLDRPGVCQGVSKNVTNDIASASGSLMQAANELSTYVLGANKRARDLAASV